MRKLGIQYLFCFIRVWWKWRLRMAQGRSEIWLELWMKRTGKLLSLKQLCKSLVVWTSRLMLRVKASLPGFRILGRFRRVARCHWAIYSGPKIPFLPTHSPIPHLFFSVIIRSPNFSSHWQTQNTHSESDLISHSPPSSRILRPLSCVILSTLGLRYKCHPCSILLYPNNFFSFLLQTSEFLRS